jgi:cell division protein FtsB
MMTGRTRRDMGWKRFSYAEFVVLVVRAVQELKADNDNLRDEVKKLQAGVAALTARAGRD